MMEQDYETVILDTERGRIEARYYPCAGTRKGAIWVGGVGGGFDTPALGLYPKLCSELTEHGVASLRIKFRDPIDLEEAVYDVLAGIRFLEQEGCEIIAMTGHSFGGAVVIQAASMVPQVRAVITLATQSYGADPARRLGPRCAMLILHGTGDRILPVSCSDFVHRLAREPKELHFYEGAGHVLDEAADDIHRLIRDWLPARLDAVQDAD